MENPNKRRAARRFSVAAAVALAAILLAAPAAPAQVWIAPDRSIVNIGPQPPVRIQVNFTPNPIVLPGNRFVRLSGPVSATYNIPVGGFRGYGFVTPFYAGDRARAANFLGSPNYNPNPIVVGPWQPWW
jgi:hypothetical protein